MTWSSSGAQFGEDAGDFFAADQNVVGPFDFRDVRPVCERMARDRAVAAAMVNWVTVAGRMRAAAERKTKAPCAAAKSSCAPAVPALGLRLGKNHHALP